MNNQPFIYVIAGVIIGALIVWGITANAVNNQNYGMMGIMGIRTGNIQTNTGQFGMGNIDAHFIEQMIPHHQDAITMARLALEQAEHDEIKTLAQNIITSQSAEIGQMKSWYKSWYGREVTTGENAAGNFGMMGGGGMHMGMMGDEDDINSLKNAENFDKAFIEEMIPHHQMAIMMASMLKNGTNRPEMKQLADDIISAQSKEIEQMRSWYKSWDY